VADNEPLRCAGALILDPAGRVFVQRRSPDRTLFPNTWDIVGGHLEPGETTIEALRREITEETGWHLLEILAELPTVTYTGDDGLVRVEEDFLVSVDGDLDSPCLEEGKHTEYRWVSAAEVPELFDPERSAPVNDLMRAIITSGFDKARAIGLVG
jgi:8-oxo-dGTP diphosphatase